MAPATAQRSLLDIRDLQIEFPTDDGLITAVQDVSFSIPEGGTVGLVGESGCGKTMTGLSLLRLIPPPGRITRGSILLSNGQERNRESPTDVASLDLAGSALRAIRGRRIAMIFQEPMSSLNPVYTIGFQIAEAVRLHLGLNRKEARDRAIALLGKVGIPAPKQRVDEYPHQLSGGMRQRVMIAIAISCNPALLIADEPTTALDVTVQAQILDLMRELQAEFGMAILMISHDLGVIADTCSEVVVMYAGRIVERGSAEQIFYNPQHPYTRGLLRSAPVLGARLTGDLRSIPGTVPNPRAIPAGCAFRPRCVERMAVCRTLPELREIEPGHLVSCWARQPEGQNAG